MNSTTSFKSNNVCLVKCKFLCFCLDCISPTCNILKIWRNLSLENVSRKNGMFVVVCQASLQTSLWRQMRLIFLRTPLNLTYLRKKAVILVTCQWILQEQRIVRAHAVLLLVIVQVCLFNRSRSNFPRRNKGNRLGLSNINGSRTTVGCFIV